MAENRSIYEYGSVDSPTNMYALFTYVEKSKSWQYNGADHNIGYIKERVETLVDEGSYSYPQTKIMVFEKYQREEFMRWKDNFASELSSQYKTKPRIHLSACKDLVAYSLLKGLTVQVEYNEETVGGREIQWTKNISQLREIAYNEQVDVDARIPLHKLVDDAVEKAIEAIDDVEGSYLTVYSVNSGVKCYGSATIATDESPEESVVDHAVNNFYDTWWNRYTGKET